MLQKRLFELRSLRRVVHHTSRCEHPNANGGTQLLVDVGRNVLIGPFVVACHSSLSWGHNLRLECLKLRIVQIVEPLGSDSPEHLGLYATYNLSLLLVRSEAEGDELLVGE